MRIRVLFSFLTEFEYGYELECVKCVTKSRIQREILKEFKLEYSYEFDGI